MKYLIVGLGNIGEEYAHTRHNIGFMVLDELARRNELKFDSGRYAFTASLKHKGKTIELIKPTTYMNLSGKALNYWLQSHKITVENSLTIVDDLALPLGKLRLRMQGSSAGHNGLGNIEETLKSNQYPRLRFGIGDHFPKGRQVEYVLGKFSAAEQTELTFAIDKACEIILSFCTVGAAQTMNFYNK